MRLKRSSWKGKKNKMDKRNKKRPWLAALLNIIIWGLGYLYVGKRKNFGILLLLGQLLIIILTAGVVESNWTLFDSLSLPGVILVYIAFAYDAYKTAKE